MQTDAEKYQELAKLFSDKRRSLHLTLKQVGRRAGVDWQAVRRFERCELKKIRPFIANVAPALGIKVSEDMLPSPFIYPQTKLNKPEFGKKVFSLRIAMGLSQDSFGKIFGLRGSVISLIENGVYKENRYSNLLSRFKQEFEAYLKKNPHLLKSL